jgi:histidinol-phosphatase (PHP family)
MKANHHTHTLFSDGYSDPEEYVKQAVTLNFDILGFTEHSPLPFDNPFSFKTGYRDKYCSLITGLKSEYAGILDIYLGMEMDYIPGISEDFAVLRREYGLDYCIGAVHLVSPGSNDNLWFTDGPSHETYDQGLMNLFAGDIRKAVSTYYRQVNEMITTQELEIVAHFDKIKMHNRGRYFREDESWYVKLVEETIHLIKERGIITEVNSRGIYKKRSDTTYPGLDILKSLMKNKIPVMINSDAHHPLELDGAYDQALSLLLEAGIKEVIHFDKGTWKFSALDQSL